ncbi:MAG: GntR family transcriptional regulator [Chloroflexaceae bacterium]
MVQLDPDGIRRGPGLALHAYASMLDLIADGRLQAGEPLLIERLTEHLGTSQTAVCEAVMRLVHEGLATEAADGRLRMISLSESYVRNVYLVRGALEGLCTELATPHIRVEDLVQLRALIHETADALARSDARPYLRSDTQLHALIIRATPNTVLLTALQTLQPHVNLINRYVQRIEGMHLLSSHQEHLEIVAAIADRDTVRARYAMEQHIRNTGERIGRLLGL